MVKPMWIDETTLLNHIPFRVDTAALARRLKVAGQPRHERDLDALAREAESLARPGALFGVAEVSYPGDDRVCVAGTVFTSRSLRRVLGSTVVVYPFLATCGGEMAFWAGSFRKLLHAYWADALMQMALDTASAALKERVTGRAGERTASVRPGIPRDWPVIAQRDLFDLFAGAEAAIGVSLSPDCLMLPLKSVSGLRFPSRKADVGCHLCGLDHCADRKAPRSLPDEASELAGKSPRRCGS